MKPIYLTLHAFGPFRDTQNIDFSRLEADGVFLITGKTGSGKTTIFDAISFSLYGEPSGSVRLSENLKSDFAPPGETCYTELTFLSKGQKYTIKRTPQQMIAKRNGDLRPVSATAFLTMENGKIISGKTEVDQKIVEIIGITKDQFKKIVLLPQGEFRNFLDADSKTRQEIFRKIFSTEPYAHFTDLLGEKSKELERKCRELTLANKGAIHSLASENDEIRALLETTDVDFTGLSHLLSTDIEKQKKEVLHLQESAKQIKNNLASINLNEMKAVNEKIVQLEQVRLSLQKLENEQQIYEDSSAQLTRLRCVQTLSAMEQTALNCHERSKELENRLEKAASSLPSCLKAYRNAAVKKESADAAYATLPILAEELSRLDAALRNFADLREKEQEQEKNILLEKSLQLKEKRLAFYVNRAEKSTLLESNKEKKFQLQHLSDLLQSYICALSKSDAAQAEYLAKLGCFLSGQAGILAQDLRENQPCPVCGSTCHPNPAHMTELLPTQQEIDHCREKMDLLAQKAQEISAVYQQLFASIKEAFNLQESSLSAPDIAARIHLEQQKLENESFVLKQEISAIERQISEDSNIEISADPRLLERDFLTQQGYRIASSLTTCAERSEELAQAVDAVRQKIPKSFDCNDTAIHLRTEIAHQIETLSQNAETAKTEFLAASSQKERLEEQIQWLQSSISEELTRKETETAAFNAAVLEAGYSQYTDYLFEKEQLSILPNLEKSIKEYENNLQKYKTLNDQLISDVGGKVPYPLEEMELLFQSLSAELADTENHYLKAETSLQQHQSVLHYLKKNLSSLQRVDEQYRTVGTLYRLANGNNNVNLSFERFILGGFFDEIIENANQRLQVLSSGRYSVNRKQNKEKGRRASGLDLEVLDIHTGKYRDTNTLSGGESFMTSLALALAVADIISATSGGVTIDTMFIDEGFGSLDSESLETAVDCLLTLRKSNRLIGIISHVSMLSDYIPIKLRIVSSPNGSSIELCSE